MKNITPLLSALILFMAATLAGCGPIIKIAEQPPPPAESKELDPPSAAAEAVEEKQLRSPPDLPSVKEHLSPSQALAAEILAVRGEPLRHIDGLPVMRLRDFGALPDSGENAYAAIQAALREITNRGGGAELVFEPGRYLIDPGDGPYSTREDSIMELQKLRNVIIEGGGAEIIIQRPSVGFVQIRESENIIVRNFTIDYETPPFTQGEVVDVNVQERWIEVKTDPGYPGLDHPMFMAFGTWGMLKDPEIPGKLKNGAPNVIFTTGFAKTADGVYRIQLRDRPRAFLETGDRWAQIIRASGGCRFSTSDQITFDNLTFHTAPGSLFVGARTSRLNVLNCRGLLKGDRLVVSTGDGVHCQAARIGPWVEGNEFQGLSDDCINIYSIPNHIRAIINERQFRLSHADRILAGDRLAFFHPQSGAVLLETTAVTIDGDLVTVADPVSGLNIAPPGTRFDGREWKIYDHVYNLDATGDYFVYRNNHFRDGRRLGGFFKASYGLIENNRFERLSDDAIRIQNEPNWPEGFWARHLVIRNNVIIDCGFNGRLPVSVNWHKLPHAMSDLRAQADIYFENNHVRAVSGPAAQFNAIDGLTLLGNHFESGSETGALVIFNNTLIRREENNTGSERFQIESPAR